MDTHIERRRQEEMNNVAEQAAAWLLELQTSGRRDDEAFLKWIAESPLHVEAFLWASTMDKALESVDPAREIQVEAASSPAVVELAESMREAVPSRPGFKHPWRWAAAAAVVALTAGTWWLAPALSGWRSYSTGVGEQRSVQLSDGSTVYINTGSRVDVRLSASARDVRLEPGEAFFDVQRDPARPFRVHSGGTVVQAIGTRFNVYRHATDTTVAVIEGRVRILPEVKDTAATATTTSTHLLAAGEQVKVAPGGRIVKRAAVDGRVTAWRQHQLVFEYDTLADIAAEFNRYNEKPKIQVEDAPARALRLLAGFNADDPESLLLVLATRYPDLEIEKEGDAVRIRSRDAAH